MGETSDAEKREAVRETEKALKKGFAEVKTAEEAAKVLDEVEQIAGEAKEQDVPTAPADIQPAEQADAIKAAAETPDKKERPAAVLAETARQVAAAPPATQPVLDAGIEKAAGQVPPARVEPYQVERGRSLLRQELMRRLKPFDAIDAAVFLQINHLPHPKMLDRFFSWFSFLMTGGHAWVLLILLRTIANRRAGIRQLLDVVPALYLATMTVEGPIKIYCRRRRPFISLVRAIVVGRKPGSYSFPSGHSAAAFAGAALLQRHHQGFTPLLFVIASLVAFSRVYLGAHYPGDVCSGSFAGAVLAQAFRASLKRIFS
jgi:undecaprenyl-diphosphatase